MSLINKMVKPSCPAYGVAQGRFQIIHKGHMEYLLKAKERCGFLFIGISDHDPERSYFDYKRFQNNDLTQPFRTLKDPHHLFTYYERALMVRESLLDEGVSPRDFSVVPFPIHQPHLLKYYIPMQATVFVTIYDQWGEDKLKTLSELGLATEVLWRRSMQERFTTGTEVRRRLAANEGWQELVPRAVERVIQEFDLARQIENLG